jgi:hypothetical protein
MDPERHHANLHPEDGGIRCSKATYSFSISSLFTKFDYNFIARQSLEQLANICSL